MIGNGMYCQRVITSINDFGHTLTGFDHVRLKIKNHFVQLQCNK